MPQDISLTVNERTHIVHADPDTPLIYVLRNDLGLNGAHYGCGNGQCWSCTIIVNGRALPACTTKLGKAAGKEITTLEGLGTPAHPHPIQKAFIEEQATQCGYCVGGIIMVAKALLDRNPHPTKRAITHALRHNICRCGAHPRVIRAIRRAAEEMAQ